MRQIGLLMSAVVLLGCAGMLGANKATDSTSSSSASGIDQDPDCKDFMRCIAVVDPADVEAFRSRYGPDGSCWNSTQDFADQCGDECRDKLSVMDAAYPDVSECDDGSSDSTTYEYMAWSCAAGTGASPRSTGLGNDSWSAVWNPG